VGWMGVDRHAGQEVNSRSADYQGDKVIRSVMSCLGCLGGHCSSSTSTVGT